MSHLIRGVSSEPGFAALTVRKIPLSPGVDLGRVLINAQIVAGIFAGHHMGDFLFVGIFAAASAVTIIEAIRRSR